MTLGQGVLCEATEPPSASTSVFVPARFGPRTYHVHLKGVDALSSTIEEHAAINFVTGCCLFSDRSLQLLAIDGTAFSFLTPAADPVSAPVTDLVYSNRLTLYELESACRLSWLTADLAASLPAVMPVSVTIDVPRIQYYLYLLEAYHHGFVTRALMLQWLELVDDRARQVSDLFHSRLASALCRLQPGKPVCLRRASGMAAVEPSIRRSVLSGEPLSAGRMGELLAVCDPVWARALGVVRVSGFRDLIYLSYAVELLRAGLSTTQRHRLCVAVDNFSERLVYEQARAIAACLADGDDQTGASLLGLYPAAHVFTSEATGRSCLYTQDPGHLFVDRIGCPYGVDELLERAYPDLRGSRTDTAPLSFPNRRLRPPDVAPRTGDCASQDSLCLSRSRDASFDGTLRGARSDNANAVSA